MEHQAHANQDATQIPQHPKQLTPSLRQGSGLEKVISDAEFLAEHVAQLVERLL